VSWVTFVSSRVAQLGTIHRISLEIGLSCYVLHNRICSQCPIGVPSRRFAYLLWEILRKASNTQPLFRELPKNAFSEIRSLFSTLAAFLYQLDASKYRRGATPLGSHRRQKPRILLSAYVLGIIGERTGSPAVGPECSRAFTSA
jgi:hypothetical protein